MSDADHPTLQQIAAAVARIEKSITGDPSMGHIGIVDRLDTYEAKTDAIERRLEKDDAKKSGALWVIASAASVAGAIGGFVVWTMKITSTMPKP